MFRVVALAAPVALFLQGCGPTPGPPPPPPGPVCTDFVQIIGDETNLGNGNPTLWETQCSNIPAGAQSILVEMGTVKDYFRPTESESICDMLQSNNKHQWSSDGTIWYSVSPHGPGWRGGGFPNSSPNPDDKRITVSAWGGENELGGCCHADLDPDDDAAWGRAYTMKTCTTAQGCTDFVQITGDETNLGNGNPTLWETQCSNIPADAQYILVEMGTAKDYFRPKGSDSICDMLQSNNKHEWSPDGTTWYFILPRGPGWRGGGFPAPNPDLKRSTISAWGGENVLGGCCFVDLDPEDDAAWGRAYTMKTCTTAQVEAVV